MIQVEQLTKRYGATLAVDGISFEVEPVSYTHLSSAASAVS